MLKSSSRAAVDQFAEIVIEGYCFEPHKSVIISLAFFCKFLDGFLELCPDERNLLIGGEQPRGCLANVHDECHSDRIFAEVVVLGRLELLANLALSDRASLQVEALLVGGGDVAEHG